MIFLSARGRKKYTGNSASYWTDRIDTAPSTFLIVESTRSIQWVVPLQNPRWQPPWQGLWNQSLLQTLSFLLPNLEEQQHHAPMYCKLVWVHLAHMFICMEWIIFQLKLVGDVLLVVVVCMVVMVVVCIIIIGHYYNCCSLSSSLLRLLAGSTPPCLFVTSLGLWQWHIYCDMCLHVAGCQRFLQIQRRRTRWWIQKVCLSFLRSHQLVCLEPVESLLYFMIQDLANMMRDYRVTILRPLSMSAHFVKHRWREIFPQCLTSFVFTFRDSEAKQWREAWKAPM